MRRIELNLSDYAVRQTLQSGILRRNGEGETETVEVSVVQEGDRNNQCDKSAFPSYSGMDFAAIRER